MGLPTAAYPGGRGEHERVGFLSHGGAPLLNGLQWSCSLKRRLDDGLQAPTHLLLLLEPPFLQVEIDLSSNGCLCTCPCWPSVHLPLLAVRDEQHASNQLDVCVQSRHITT